MKAVALLLVCACGPVRDAFELGINSPIAVGAVFIAKPSSSTTVRIGLTQTTRRDRDVTIVSSSMEPADAWEQVECMFCSGAVRYRALRANNGTLTVRADDGLGVETFVKSIEAITPERVKLFVKPCEQLSYQAGINFKLDFQLLSGERALTDGQFPITSFAVEGGATLEGVPSALWVKTVNARGPGRITSRLDPTLSVPFTVFTPGDVTAIDVVRYSPLDPTTLTVGKSKAVEVLLTHPGAPACEDRLVRTVSSLTPDVCDTLNSTTATKGSDGRYFVTLRGKLAGTCTLKASVEGTQVSVTRDFQTVPP